MKNLIIIISIFALHASRGMAQVSVVGHSGTAGDYVGWNAGQVFPLEIRHKGSEPMIFYTDDTEWMRLTPAGFLGINTASPSMRFHVHNGGILATGTTGTNPNLGAGTRFMWIPDVQAFRAGTAVGTEWDSGDVGTNSFAFGEDVTASADFSVAFGEENVVEVDAHHGVAMGKANQVISPYSVALGVGNIAGSTGSGSEGCVALGDQNQALGHDTFAVGEYCVSDGQASVGLGYSNDVLGFAPVPRDLQSRGIIEGSPEPCIAFSF